MSDAQTSAAQTQKPLMVVTGGSRGIGRAITEKALASGYQVAVADVSKDDLTNLEAEVGSADLHTGIVDITDEYAVDAWLNELIENVGVPAALVNNAGIMRGSLLEDIKLDDWRAALDVNLTGAFIMTQRIGRAMIANGGGSIVSIASTASIAWPAGCGSYSPSKAAIAMLMRGVAMEWGKYGIRGNSVSPGYTETPMTAPIFADPEKGLPRLARVPLGRIAQPSEIAAVVVFLCSSEASYVSGQNIAVDGGSTISTLLAPVPPTHVSV
ncbi:MAG: 3-oxoacyl-(acyl-carrier-protein) reductase [Pseudonocardiales bacterium]|nr:3-oxoacyl-(acyl-carrier-protein) reductase [Pseudonocardiales bacterium]